MPQEDIKTINELIEKLRQGKIAGTIQIKVDNKGRLNNIFVRNLNAQKEIEDQIEKVKLKGKTWIKSTFQEQMFQDQTFLV